MAGFQAAAAHRATLGFARLPWLANPVCHGAAGKKRVGGSPLAVKPTVPHGSTSTGDSGRDAIPYSSTRCVTAYAAAAAALRAEPAVRRKPPAENDAYSIQ